VIAAAGQNPFATSPDAAGQTSKACDAADVAQSVTDGCGPDASGFSFGLSYHCPAAFVGLVTSTIHGLVRHA
jgi:hypothetical protein